MKYLLLSLFGLLSVSAVKAQSQSPDAYTDSVYTTVDKAASYTDGVEMFYWYVAKALRYPVNAVKKNIEGKVIVRIIIEKDGKVSHAEVKETSKYAELDAEALRVTSLSPNWIPAEKDGKAVRSTYTFPILFKVAGQ